MVLSSKQFKFFFLTVLTFISCFNALYAQRAKQHTLTPDQAKEVKKDAAVSFSTEDYNTALKGYTDLVKASPSNPEYNYRLGVCILLTNSLKSKAAGYLEAGQSAKEAKKDIGYFLGMAYMHTNQWDEAIESFNRMKNNKDFKLPKGFTSIDRMIEMCYNAKELIAHPVDVKFDNMGKNINSPFEDYSPYISADDRALVYSSRRKGNMGGFIADLGIYAADVFSSVFRDSTGWTKGKGVGAALNTEWDEETVGMSHDGKIMFVYFDNMEAYGDIGVSMLKGRNWQRGMMLGAAINQKSVESGACISNDGQTLYFSSDRTTKDGLGGSDIWFCQKQTTGEWGAPTNMGSIINTKYDETSPYISIDGRTLYFASKGHNSMGGFDIFSSTWDEAAKKWNAPQNLGYPLNTTDDETSFSMTGNGRYAYIAAVKEGGFGERDIYKVTFNDESSHPFLSVVSGAVNASPGKVELREVSLISKKDNTVTSVYRPYFLSNEYVLSAPPGEYILKVDGYGFKPIEEEIALGDEDLNKDFSVTLAK